MEKKTLRRMLRYLLPYKILLIFILCSAVCSVFLTLAGPILIGWAIDSVVGAGQVDFAKIMGTLGLFALSSILAMIFQWGMQVSTRKISAYVAQQIRNEAFQNLNMLPLKEIDAHKQGDFVNRLVNDADALSEGYLQGLSQLFPGVVTILATFVLMLLLNPAIMLIVVLVTPLSILFAHLVTRRTGSLFVEQSVAQGGISAFVSEMVENQEIVRDFGYENRAAQAFADKNKQYYTANFKATLYSSIINPGTRFVNALVYAAVGVFGALSVLSGGISIGGVSIFLAYANQYTKPFNEITSVFTQLQGAAASASRLFEVIDLMPEPPDSMEALTLAHSNGAVCAENIFFSYDKKHPFIQDLAFSTMQGQRIALVGPTGCGKTTVINLLMRFYDVDSGTIIVDGMPILGIKRNALRGLYGMVLQETWLKRTTIRENIAYAKPLASTQEIINAAKAAYAHSFIMRLPQGYDTLLDSAGSELSAGQKQLLCIARIILAKPDMLILDEATSSIDTRTELLIQKALETLMQGHTSFIVAHRLSTVQNADRILVMEAGQVVESGTHTELLERNGFYKKLYTSQFVLQ